MKDPRPRPARSTNISIGRRKFLRSVPAAIAAGVAAPALAQQFQQQEPARFGKGALKSAEEIFGLDFHDAEGDMMLRGVSRNLDSYETLRKLDIPQATEPAFVFHPYLPGKRPAAGVQPRRARLSVAAPPPVKVGKSLEDLAFLPVTALAPLIESRRVTSTALTKMYLDRLKRYGDRLKCVVTLTEEQALAQAVAADKEIAAGKYRGPLHGIPWGAKDLLATKGIRTTFGAKPYENQVIDMDATVVQRLHEAGAVLVAKLSMGALAMGAVWYGGTTRSPWNTERGSSSGSSAGPASATAAGLVGFAIGTETLGSIISPSSTCGVTGLRPTYGRVSRHGAMALSWTMDKIGPICRSVEDCALVFNAIYGSDGKDDSVVDAPFAWNPLVPLSKLRIAFLKSEFDVPPAAANMSEQQRKTFEQRKAVHAEALDAFRKAGAKLEPIDLPEFPAQAIRFILNTEGAAAFDDLTRSRGIDLLTAQGPGDWPNTFRTSRFVPAVEYLRAMRARTLLMQKMDEMMSRCDVFISQTNSASLTITNLTGHPALCLKSGFVDNVPAAVMITGRLYDEATLLRVALAYERATKWHTMNPTLA
jgi:Asp-tRNA(Asn)/Glu-tRNA(Gln) amidotransferase A subunit family amidase